MTLQQLDIVYRLACEAWQANRPRLHQDYTDPHEAECVRAKTQEALAAVYAEILQREASAA